MLVHHYIRLVKAVILMTCLAPLVLRAVGRHIEYERSGGQGSFFTSTFLQTLGAGLVATAVIFGILWYLLKRFERTIVELSESQGEFADTLSSRYIPLAIFASAGLSLFLELAMIRWQISIFHLLSFYKNFGLLSCFAGLGLGYALAERKTIPFVLIVPLIAMQITFQIFLAFGMGTEWLNFILASPIVEQVGMGQPLAKTVPQFAGVYYLLADTFLLTALAFIPLGQLIGRLMMRTTNLHAYGWNLLGSVAGVLAMLGLSYLWTPPVVWFGAAFIIIAAFSTASKRGLIFTSVASLLTLIVLAWPVGWEIQRIHSPYQLLERSHYTDGSIMVRVSGHYYQNTRNLSNAYIKNHPDPEVQFAAAFYGLPFEVAGPGGKAAVVGAGTGNDVAAALRHDMSEVHAVEIDPAILEMGRVWHPEQPYSDPRVHPVVNDARTFFRSTDESFDLIVYGLLDSHSVLSHASSVRLDSFVYTVEGFAEARERLTDDGMLSLSFYILTPELMQKIYLMMTEAFDGHPPAALKSDEFQSYTFMQNKQGNLEVASELLDTAGYENVGTMLQNQFDNIDVATDDWPFFYMPRRVYPFSYLGVVALMLGLTVLLIRNFTGESPAYSQATFFLLGAGFMLVETKAITELGLTFGNTWQIIGIVISGILVMAFFANALVDRFNIKNLAVPFGLLFVTIIVGYIVARYGGFPSTTAGRVGAVLLLTSPIFFSGIVFSTALATESNISRIMSANLFGAMCGGLLEYNAMKFGFQSLYLFGLALYALAALQYFRGRARTSTV